ncbi:MAG TPA: S24 family peptidase [Rubricoccaceae bacterium]
MAQVLDAPRNGALPPQVASGPAITLDDLVATSPEATFFVRVEGSTMHGAGVHDGDVLVVDCARIPVDGDLVVIETCGETYIRRVQVKEVRGVPRDSFYTDENGRRRRSAFPVDVTMWGVAVGLVRPALR